MALWNNFPYVDLHELNLDYLIKKMKALEAKWEAISTKVTASAQRGNQAGVTVEGSLEDGLNFNFTLPAGTLATTSHAGEVQPDGSTIAIGTNGIISSRLSGIALRQGDQGGNVIDEPDTFVKIQLNATTENFGDASVFSRIDDDYCVRINKSGVYLIEGSTWVTAISGAKNTQLRVMQGDSYENANPIAWGITTYSGQPLDLPVNTSMRVVTLEAGARLYMDVAIAGSTGSYRYANRETQLTVVRIA